MRFAFDERPFIIIWEITRACALACRHCRASADSRRHPLELSTAEAKQFLLQVARARPELFVITGGDPIRRPDLQELIAYASGQGLRVALSPSATPELIAADLAALKGLGVARISLSLDGATRASHDGFRGVPGTWDLTLQAMEKAARAQIPVQINTTFTRQNLGEFDAFTRLLVDLKPVLWSVFQLVPTGRGRNDDLLSADEMEELFVRLYRHSRTAPYDIKTTEGYHYRRVVLQQSRLENQPLMMTRPGPVAAPSGPGPRSSQRAPLGINDGKGFVFISHLGEIQPSGFLPISAGNVRRDELIDVYRNSALFRELRDVSLLKGKCGNCEFRNICGGSRARAYAMTGDYLGEEPLCAYQPARERADASRAEVLG